MNNLTRPRPFTKGLGAGIYLRFLWCASLTLAGCAHSWPPRMEHLRRADESMISDLSEWTAPPGTKKVFRRTDFSPRSSGAERYAVVVESHRRVEGELCGEPIGPLRQYLSNKAGQDAAHKFIWPSARNKSRAAFFLEFDPPLGCTPVRVAGGSRQQCESDLQLFDWKGQPTRRGHVARRTRFEGFDSVRIGKAEYDECLLLYVEMHFHVPWVARVDTAEYIWLARGLGEVKRLARWSGFVFPTFFDETSQYELIEHHPAEPAASGSATQSVDTPSDDSLGGYRRVWRRCAVFLDPALPSPQLEGLVVE